MNGMHYAILGYVVSLALMWGYAASLWLAHRAVDRRERKAAATP